MINELAPHFYFRKRRGKDRQLAGVQIVLNDKTGQKRDADIFQQHAFYNIRIAGFPPLHDLDPFGKIGHPDNHRAAEGNGLCRRQKNYRVGTYVY